MRESLSLTSYKVTLPHKNLVTSPVSHKTSQDFVATTINGLGVSPATKTGPSFSKSQKSQKCLPRQFLLIKFAETPEPVSTRQVSVVNRFRFSPKTEIPITFRRSDVPMFRCSDVPNLTKSVQPQPRSRRHFNCRS